MFRALVGSKGRVAKNEQIYTNAGTYSFTVPDNVFWISAVLIGGGGGGSSSSTYSNVTREGGQGGTLAYGTIQVTPGETLTIKVGDGGEAGTFYFIQYTPDAPRKGGTGESSYISRGSEILLRAPGGRGGAQSTSTVESVILHDEAVNTGSYRGGYGGVGGGSEGFGGGGAGGYSGVGGNGSNSVGGGTSGSGGAGSGGAYGSDGEHVNPSYTTAVTARGGRGGGTYIYGEGSSGTMPTPDYFPSYDDAHGNPGSLDATGAPSSAYGVSYGAGGFTNGRSPTPYDHSSSGAGSRGAVRLVWPGRSHYFPTANVGQP